MKKNNAIILLAIFILLIALFIGCDREKTSLTPPDEDVPDQIIENFELIETEVSLLSGS